MKRLLLRLLLLFLLFFPIYVFWVYSSTSSVGPDDVEELQEYTSVCESTACWRQSESPVLTQGIIENGIGLRFAGFCTIEQDGCYAACLMRGFPPPNHAQMDCVIVPRRLITIGGRCFFLCAIVAYRPSRVSTTFEE